MRALRCVGCVWGVRWGCWGYNINNIEGEMEEQVESSAEEEHFSQAEIVWAKITGYPWWPALVTGAASGSGTFRVDFFADNTHAFVSRGKLAKYESLRGEVDLHKHMKKGLRRAIATADQLVRDRLAALPLRGESSRPVEARPATQKQLLQLPSIKTTALQPPPRKNTRERPAASVADEAIDPEQEEGGEEEGGEGGEEEAESVPMLQYSLQRRKKYAALLLRKYQLDNLVRSDEGEPSRGSARSRDGRCRRKRQATCRSKTKKITKNQNNPNTHRPSSLLLLLSRRVDHFLGGKRELCKVQRREIAINLAKQVQGHHVRLENAVQQVTKLLKWVEISPSDTIASYYESWSSFQSEKEKASNMTNEE